MCDICGETYSNAGEYREVQIRKYRNLNDTRPVLEKTCDVCIYCIDKFLKGEKSNGG